MLKNRFLVTGAVVEENLKLLLSLRACAGVVIVHQNGSLPSPNPPYILVPLTSLIVSLTQLLKHSQKTRVLES